jgi:hypothetical protein
LFSVSGQDLTKYIRRTDESALEYVTRIKASSERITYRVIETNVWDSKYPSIVVFYQNLNDKENRPEILGHLYMKQYDVEYYRDISFGDLIGEDEYPEIVDIFWYNIDDDKEKEMFVIYKYHMLHYDFTGYVYDVCVFDNPNIYSDSLESLDQFEGLFVGFEGISGESVEYSPAYSSKEEVIQKLMEMGYYN